MDERPQIALLPRRGGAGTPAPLFADATAPAPSHVHTLETSVGPEKAKRASTTKKDREEIRKEKRDEEYFRNRGFGDVLSGFATPAAEPLELAYRHGWWSDERQQVFESLKRSGANAAALERFENCGADCFVRVHKPTQRPAFAANTCRHRFCKPCAITRANLISGNLRDRLKDRRWEKFLHIVLTLKSRPCDLADEIRRIYQCFRKLRSFRLGTVPRSPKFRGRVVNWWGNMVRGGAAFCEVTLNDDERDAAFGLWHVHLHIIAESRYVPMDDLKSLWHLATGDSHVCRVEAIKDKAGAAVEVAKYAAKGIDSAIAVSPFKLDELLIAMKSCRLCTTFGKWRGWRLLKKPEFNPDEWVTIGRLVDVHAQAEGGCPRAIKLLQLLCNSPP